ncbi:Uncharacterised protein [Mycobacterium tuberculosis]|uniref:Uncharacterized protein n=1 Tax=Mycobacterium tuberculosis TaxID=1773 RepID=A0A654U0N0_MYCTX|nr:Uncharacterised protein [Mycobacterium tuberculosis]CFS29605.1 Uncharacterised protein [Mycobacterium tuberculosis]COW71715.1 Uncharacterised protein [Mycobacterium tuberculosis]COX28303.1 Uncharacterised protein [Mycobacterium tuberculosis]COY29040.1 Uncharacterised protein [Mycobacterium tuberculosis]
MAVSLLSRKYAKVPITKFKAKPTTMNPTMAPTLDGLILASSSPPCQPMASSRYRVRPW